VSFLNKTYLKITAAAYLIAMVNACAPPATKSIAPTTYDEDISIYRNKYEPPAYSFDEKTQEDEVVLKPIVEPSHHIKNELDSILLKVKKSKENIKYIEGLSIQVYSGNDKEKAYEIKKQIYSVSEVYSPKVTYDQPNYKVSVGEYYTRMEANKDYNVLKTEFAQALLVPIRIPIESNN